MVLVFYGVGFIGVRLGGCGDCSCGVGLVVLSIIWNLYRVLDDSLFV